MFKINLKSLLALSFVAFGGLAGSTTAAQAEGTWCAVAGGSAAYSNCGYHSFRQCMASVRGVGGTCQPNPRVRTYIVEDERGTRVYRRYYR